MLRWLAARLIRGPHAEFILQDLEDIYLRERARGVSLWRAQIRHLRRLVYSAFSVWHGDRPSRARPHVTSPRGIRGGHTLQDFRFALRLCRKHPVPVGIAIGGLALAIGVASSVFTVVNLTMLKPFGMDRPSSVVSVGSTRMHGWSEWTYSTFLRMRAEATLSRVEASLPVKVRYSREPGSDNEPSRPALFVSGGYLQMLGGRPEHGRSLDTGDEASGAALVGVVSHHFWSTELNADTSVIGKPLWINGVAVSIVGVLRADFTGPVTTRPSFWVPLSAFDDLLGAPALDAKSATSVEVVGRIADGVGWTAAQENLSAVVNRASTRGAESVAAPSPVQLFSAASPIAGRDAAESYVALACIFGLVALVLGVACANTANLLFAAAATRSHEMGVRLSLGASTQRLVRQMVNESLALAMIAAAFGLLFSVWLGPLLSTAIGLSSEWSIVPDARVVVFTLAVALICGLGTGLSPARHGARGDVLAALKSQSQAGAFVGSSWLRTSFVGFQAAVSIFLLVAAALFAKTAVVMSRMEIGFDADRLVAVSFGGTRTGFNEAAYMRTAMAYVRGLPSVERASMTQHVPWGRSLHRVRFSHGGSTYLLNLNLSDEDFFPTAGVRLVRGRTFTRDEVEHQAPVALISQSVARAFFGPSDPVGQRLSAVPSAEFQAEPATVVGVVADALLTPVDAEVYGSVYRPIRRLSADSGKPSSPPGIVIRTNRPARTAREVTEVLRGIDPRIQPDFQFVRESMEPYFSSKRMFAWLSVPTAIVAVLLSVLGMFGVTAFLVSQRMHELSIRFALGASARDVRRLLLKDSMRPAAIGVVSGLSAALLAARFTARMFDLSGISPHDPVAVGAAVAIVLAGVLVAVLTPIRRATKANPASLLHRV